MKSHFVAPAALLLFAASVWAQPKLASTSVKPSVLALAGYEPLKGEGVVVTLSDVTKSSGTDISKPLPGLVHDFDVLAVINELRFAGAQGITVGGVRLTNQSSVRATGPVLLVDSKPVATPLRIEAVGNALLMKARLNARGGLVSTFKASGPGLKVSVLPQLQLKAAPLPR